MEHFRRTCTKPPIPWSGSRTQIYFRPLLNNELGWVGNWSKICIYSVLGWVMGLKSRLSAEKVESVELIRWGCVQA